MIFFNLLDYFNVERFFPNNSDGLYLQYNFEEYQQEIQKLCFLQGLSKKGVEVLKRWFYRHRHHPYPTEVEKKTIVARIRLIHAPGKQDQKMCLF